MWRLFVDSGPALLIAVAYAVKLECTDSKTVDGARFTVEPGITAYKRGVIYRNGRAVPKNYRKAAKPGYPR